MFMWYVGTLYTCVVLSSVCICSSIMDFGRTVKYSCMIRCLQYIKFSSANS